MSEGGEARCSDCGKTPETCWLPPHLCKHPDREGGEARNHNGERGPVPWRRQWLDWRVARIMREALEAVGRA